MTSSLPSKEAIRDFKFSSLACKIHDWIHSPMRPIISKAQKNQCEAVIALLAEKLATESSDPSRTRVVERLRRDLEAKLTHGEVLKRKQAAKS